MKKKEKLLFDAIESNNINDVKKALKKGFLSKPVNLNTFNSDGMAPIHLAIKKGAIEITEFLIKNGADVNLKNKYKRTPLMLAGINGHVKLMKLLINNNANINETTDEGETVLHLSNLEILPVKILLDLGMNVNIKDNYGRTALIGASNKTVIQMLVDKGADINIKSNKGVTPLMYATEYFKGVGIVELLLSLGANPNIRNNEGKTAIMLTTNKKDLMSLLIHGADFSMKDNQDNSVERYLDKHSDLKTIIDSYKKISNKQYTKDNPQSVLFDSISWNQINLFNSLINDGIDVNTSFNNNSILQFALMERKPEFAKILIEKGANVNKEDFFTAIRNGYSEIVEIMLQKGMNPNSVDFGNYDRPALFMPAYYYSLGLNSLNACKEIMISLINHGADINKTEKLNGFTPLFQTVDAKLFPLTKILLENGADVNIKSFSGDTPLLISIQTANITMVQLLIDNGADISIENNDGLNALNLSDKLLVGWWDGKTPELHQNYKQIFEYIKNL